MTLNLFIASVIARTAIVVIPIANNMNAMINIQSGDSVPSPIEAAGRVHRNVFIWSVLWVVLSALVTALLAYLLWQASNRQQDAIQAYADARIAEAGERAAQADERAATSNAEAAKANESTARLNERARKLEQENIRLRTDLENAAAEANSKQTKLTREQQKIAKEQQKTAEAQKESAQIVRSAQLHLQQMRSLHMPRRLIAGQNREGFLKLLKGRPAAAVDILWFSDGFIPEPKRFAEDIAEALTEAGWTVNKLEGGSLTPDNSNPLNATVPSGLKIKVRNLYKIPPSANALFGAFLESGLVSEFIADEKLEDGPVKLIVFMIPADGGRALRLSK